MFRYRSGQCNIIGFFLLIGLGIAVVCGAETPNRPSEQPDPIARLELQLQPHRAHLAELVKHQGTPAQAPTFTAKLNVALDLIVAARLKRSGNEFDYLAAERLVRELPPALQEKFLFELAELKGASADLAPAILEFLNVWNRQAKVEVPIVTTEGTRAILDRLNQLRSCPSQTTAQEWQQKLDHALGSDRDTRRTSGQAARRARGELASAQQSAIGAERAFLNVSRDKLKDLAALLQRKDALSNQRDDLRQRTQKALSAIFPSTNRPSQQLFAAAISMVPVFNDYQRNAPLWRYEGLDVRASEAKPTAENFRALDAPEFQKYFVESLTENRAKDFVFTLTEAGKQALSRPFFPIEKIAVHRLAELDAAQDRSRELFAAGDRLRGEEKDWESRNRGLIAQLKEKLRRKEANRSKLVAANDKLESAERNQRQAEARLQQDEQANGRLRACFTNPIALDDNERHAGERRRGETTH